MAEPCIPGRKGIIRIEYAIAVIALGQVEHEPESIGILPSWVSSGGFREV